MNINYGCHWNLKKTEWSAKSCSQKKTFQEKNGIAKISKKTGHPKIWRSSLQNCSFMHKEEDKRQNNQLSKFRSGLTLTINYINNQFNYTLGQPIQNLSDIPQLNTAKYRTFSCKSNPFKSLESF